MHRQLLKRGPRLGNLAQIALLLREQHLAPVDMFARALIVASADLQNPRPHMIRLVLLRLLHLQVRPKTPLLRQKDPSLRLAQTKAIVRQFDALRPAGHSLRRSGDWGDRSDAVDRGEQVSSVDRGDGAPIRVQERALCHRLPVRLR